MTTHHQPVPTRRRTTRRTCRASGFSLVELLTVVFIISLLIGILIPSINAARKAAKRTVTSNTIRSIDAAMQMFKDDNGSDFPQSNGFPPSFSHPPIRRASGGQVFDRFNGEFPFTPGAEVPLMPRVYGAHWLPAMLMGADSLGYVKRRSVPAAIREEPWKWYYKEPVEGQTRPLERAPLYIDPSGAPTKRTVDLPGTGPVDTTLFPGWGFDPTSAQSPFQKDIQGLPVIIDAFDQAILYYVANSNGQSSNMLEDEVVATNTYTGGIQQEGVPYYFHQDNEGFTGFQRSADPAETRGWNYAGIHVKENELLHPIAETGSDYDPKTVISERPNSFASYILDRKLQRELASKIGGGEAGFVNLRPVNAESYLLISPGPDGRYGTRDDVSNLPKKLE